jgi:integrase
MRRVQRHTTGSVRFDKRRGTWNYLWYDGAIRRSKRIGTKSEFPTKSAAWKEVERMDVGEPKSAPAPSIAVKDLVETYRTERMPQRYTTARSYNVWLDRYVLPRWGNGSITAMQAQPVELWLRALPLSSRSKSDIRALIRRLWDCAMWRGDLPAQRNPMELVRIPGASKRTRQPRVLTAEEYRVLLSKLRQPFRTIALMGGCFGLRISECLGLRWSDVDWLQGRLQIQRGVVRNRVADCKTVGSEKAMPIDPAVMDALKLWRTESPFNADTDWVFASPAKIGRLPWASDSVLRAFQSAGVGHLGTHSLRHSFRSWLQAVGTPVAVQQKLMRHADIRTTMNVYGDTFQPELAEAASKLAGLVLNGAQAERRPV